MHVEIDRKLLEEFESAQLFCGNHSEGSAELCAMEWGKRLAKEGHGDNPACVAAAIRSFMISLNDSWKDDDRQLLKPFVVLSLGTAAGPELEARRGIACLDWTMRTHRPLWFEAAGLDEYAAKMRALPEIVDEATFAPARELQKKGVEAARAARAARDARDARAARAAWAARAARDARDAWAARAAWDAWDAWDAWAARAARAARAAWAAWAARDARAARAAWAARAARAATLGLVATRAFGARGMTAETPKDELDACAIEAWETIAKKVRESELVLLKRLIEMR